MVDCKRCVFYGKCTIANEFVGQIRKCRDFTLQTNADRIRKMSDEELAEFLTDHHRYPCKYCGGCPMECSDGLLQWLKSEVKE